MSSSQTAMASAVVTVMRRALAQNDKTPEDQLLSYRTLCEVALPLLEHLAEQQEGGEPCCQ